MSRLFQRTLIMLFVAEKWGNDFTEASEIAKQSNQLVTRVLRHP